MVRRHLRGPATALAMLLASGAQAELTPSRSHHDDRVRIAPYVDGEVYRLNTTLLNVTTVEFAPGETIVSIIAGDTEGFEFDGVPGGRAFAVKPVMDGVHTNITVYTTVRSYYFDVAEVNGPTHYVVRFSYPDAAPPQDAVARDAPNYRYGVSGPSEFTPRSVWDDGTFTYFEFSPNVPLPAILRVGSEGGERSVNSTTQEDGVVRVSGVGPRWVLRLGDQVVCIEALAGEAAS